VGRYYVQMFDASLAQWCGVQPGVCSMGETCGDALVVEHNGDVYSCDHFVYPEYKLGNIAQTPLDEIYRTAKRREFGLNKRNTLPTECLPAVASAPSTASTAVPTEARKTRSAKV